MSKVNVTYFQERGKYAQNPRNAVKVIQMARANLVKEKSGESSSVASEQGAEDVWFSLKDAMKMHLKRKVGVF